MSFRPNRMCAIDGPAPLRPTRVYNIRRAQPSRRFMIDIDRPFLGQDPFDQNVRSGIEGSGVGTWDLEFATRELTWSNTTRKLFGVSPDKPIDYALFLSLLDLQDRDRTAAAIQKSIETGCNFDAEYRVHRNSDAGHWVRALGAIVNGRDGEPARLSGIVLDIDKEKRLEEALRTRERHFRSILDTIPDAMIVIDEHGIMQFFSSAAERQFGHAATEAIGKNISAMGEIASALAHELNQPLSAISNYMKGSRRLLAASANVNASKIETALDRAAEQAIRAGDIIRRLRNFVARDASEKRVESLSKLLEEAGALGLTGAREQGVLLRFNLDPTCDLVLADRVQIQQVLVNLFRNALEAMVGSTHRELIASNTKAADDMIEIAVSDTGPGFASDTLANLFQPFFTTKETGMGVGLSISRTIIESHGGRMWAETNRSGGATFRFTLTAAPAKDVTDAAER